MDKEQKFTPEVEKLLLASRGLYDAATRAKLTPGLAIALRDGVAFDKLQIDEIAALARFVRELEKAGAPAAEQAPAASNGNASAAPEGKPDDKKGKASKSTKDATSTP